MKIKLALLISGIFISNFTYSQDLIEIGKETKIKSDIRPYATNVSGNTYIIRGKGGNIGFHVGENEILMVDNQFADATEAILSQVEQISDKPIKYLINTHHHGDHTGGNVNMTANGTTIIAHENVRKRLLYVKSNDMMMSLPVITFSENMTLHFDNEDIFAFHIDNAHTSGDVIIYFPQTNVMHTGDAFVNKMYPYIDEKSGGTVNGYIEGLEKMMLILNKTTKVIPGHGPIGNYLDLDYTKRMLENFITRVKIEISKGKTEDEIVANPELTKFYDDLGYGDGFINSEKMRKTIYNYVIATYVEDQKAKIEKVKKQQNEKAKKSIEDKG